MAKYSIILFILAALSLIALGVTMLASTTFQVAQEGGEDYVTLWRQLGWLGVATVLCVIMAVVDYNVWMRWRWHRRPCGTKSRANSRSPLKPRATRPAARHHSSSAKAATAKMLRAASAVPIRACPGNMLRC